MSFPPAHFLMGAAAAELVRARVGAPRWKAWLLGAAMGALPDLDIVLGLATGSASAYHGTFTHSLFATAIVAAALWTTRGPRWSAVGAAGYASHLLVDLLDDRGRTNVLLAWPVSDVRPFAIARLFPPVPFEQGHGMSGALLSLFRPDVFARLLEQTAIAAAFLAAAIVATRFYERR